MSYVCLYYGKLPLLLFTQCILFARTMLLITWVPTLHQNHPK